MTTNPITAERSYRAEIDDVWQAITDAHLMRQWFFPEIRTFEPAVGAETRFIVHVDDRDYVHVWNVTEVGPQRRLVYLWRYDGIPGDSTVTWKPTRSATGTQLVLTQSGCETFPQDNRAFHRDTVQSGWDYFVHDRLRAFLEGTSHVAYRRRMHH